MGTVFLISLPPALAGLWFYLRWFRSRAFHLGEPAFGWPDMVSGALLSLWFVSLLAGSGNEEVVVTPEAIIASAIVYGGIVGLILFSLAVRKISLRKAFGFGWNPGMAGLVGMALVAALPIVFAAQVGASLVPGETRQPLLDFWLQNPEWTNRALVVGMAVIVAPVCEETIFRGFLFNVGRRLVGPLWSLVVSSLLFAAIHAHLPSFAGLFLLAVGFNLVYAWTGSLLAPMAMHAAFNGISLAMALLWPKLA